MASYFLSDVHLKSSIAGLDDKLSGPLLFFFQNIWPKAPGDIYLLGDIFDIWVSDHHVFQKKYQKVIAELKKIKSLGYKIIYFEGNHDLHLKRFWQKELGFDVHFDVGYFEIEKHIFRLEHGDLINLEDHEYLRLRRVLRSPTMLFLGHWLPGILWNKIGEKWSQKSRKTSHVYLESKKSEIVSMVRRHALRSYNEKPFDVIITGHMHITDDFEFTVNSKKIRSINLGTWLDGAKVLRFEDGQFSWIDYESLKTN